MLLLYTAALSCRAVPCRVAILARCPSRRARCCDEVAVRGWARREVGAPYVRERRCSVSNLECTARKRKGGTRERDLAGWTRGLAPWSVCLVVLASSLLLSPSFLSLRFPLPHSRDSLSSATPSTLVSLSFPLPLSAIGAPAPPSPHAPLAPVITPGSSRSAREGRKAACDPARHSWYLSTGTEGLHRLTKPVASERGVPSQPPRRHDRERARSRQHRHCSLTRFASLLPAVHSHATHPYQASQAMQIFVKSASHRPSSLVHLVDPPCFLSRTQP